MDADGTVPNPECAAILQTIEATELELRTNEALAAPLQQQVEGEGSQLARQSEGYREYASLAQAIRETEKGLDAARGDVELANATLGRLSNQAPVKVLQKASPPTRPTEPNILLVALIGCVLGLGVAIALILLIDVLQGSFKTVDDVERGLTVPVLGGMSHLETLEERQGALRSRRRITLVTASFVALVGGVVALFYWDPTRLPVFVRDLLQVVLGTT
ncbi:MAG: hypothetical protein FJ265_05210 [Planctomycetes bacterium]|nr:hypothetical protein [Planctomycetota bacterium]